MKKKRKILIVFFSFYESVSTSLISCFSYVNPKRPILKKKKTTCLLFFLDICLLLDWSLWDCLVWDKCLSFGLQVVGGSIITLESDICEKSFSSGNIILLEVAGFRSSWVNECSEPKFLWMVSLRLLPIELWLLRDAGYDKWGPMTSDWMTSDCCLVINWPVPGDWCLVV